MDSSPLSSGLLPFSFLFLFCFVYRTNTCMSYRINQLDKIWKVVVLLLYFFFCYLVNIKKKFGNFTWFFFLLVSLAGKVNMDSGHGKVYLAALYSFIQSKTDPFPPIWIASLADTIPCKSLLVFRSSTIKSFKCARNK